MGCRGLLQLHGPRAVAAACLGVRPAIAAATEAVLPPYMCALTPMLQVVKPLVLEQQSCLWSSLQRRAWQGGQITVIIS